MGRTLKVLSVVLILPAATVACIGLVVGIWGVGLMVPFALCADRLGLLD